MRRLVMTEGFAGFESEDRVDSPPVIIPPDVISIGGAGTVFEIDEPPTKTDTGDNPPDYKG